MSERNYLVKPSSNLFVCGSNLRTAGVLKIPIPARVVAATLTEYVTPDVKFASINDGEDASTLMFAKIFDILYVSKPRIIT